MKSSGSARYFFTCNSTQIGVQVRSVEHCRERLAEPLKANHGTDICHSDKVREDTDAKGQEKQTCEEQLLVFGVIHEPQEQVERIGGGVAGSIQIGTGPL